MALALDFPMEGMGPAKTKLSVTETFSPWENQRFLNGKLSVPIYKDENQTVTVNGESSSWIFPEMSGTSSSENLPIPKTLEARQFGVNYVQKLEQDESFSLGISYGSSSDHPFADQDVSTTTSIMTYSFPSAKDPAGKWNLILYYSNHNPVFRDIPIPGLSYFYKSADMIGAFGFPFAFVKWMPKGEIWNLTALAFGGSTWKTEAAVGAPFGGPSAFLGLEWTQNSWLRQGRRNTDEKLFFDQKQVHIGARGPLAPWLSYEATVGYAFERNFFESKSYFSERAGKVVRLPDSGFAHIDLTIQI